MNSKVDIFDKLQEAFTDAEKHQMQAFDESVRIGKSSTH